MVSNAGINPVAGPILNVSSFLDLFLLNLRITLIFFFFKPLCNHGKYVVKV